MNIKTAKKEATAAGLVLYWDSQWQSWGLIDPDGHCESEWMSSGDLHSMDAHRFGQHIATMHGRMHPDAGGPFPIA